MGMGYGFRCLQCNYYIGIDLGFGFLFPKVYKETYEKAKMGDYGDYIKEFIDAFPDGKIDAEDILIICQDCGNLEVVPDLSMYIPKEGYVNENVNKAWSVEYPIKGIDYATHRDLINHYELFESYQHKCKKCHGNMEFVARDKLDNYDLKCPNCKIILSLDYIERWE